MVMFSLTTRGRLHHRASSLVVWNQLSELEGASIGNPVQAGPLSLRFLAPRPFKLGRFLHGPSYGEGLAKGPGVGGGYMQPIAPLSQSGPALTFMKISGSFKREKQGEP